VPRGRHQVPRRDHPRGTHRGVQRCAGPLRRDDLRMDGGDAAGDRARPVLAPRRRRRCGRRLPVTGTPTGAAEPDTPAIQALAASGIEYEVTAHGPVRSLEEAAEARGVEPRQILKTLVVRRAEDDYLFVLVPG